MDAPGKRESDQVRDALIVVTGASLSLTPFVAFGAYNTSLSIALCYWLFDWFGADTANDGCISLVSKCEQHPAGWVWGCILIVTVFVAGATALFVRAWRQTKSARTAAVAMSGSALASLAGALFALSAAGAVLVASIVALYFLSVTLHDRATGPPSVWTKWLFLSVTLAGVAALVGALGFVSRLTSRRCGSSVLAAIALASAPALLLAATLYAGSSELYRCRVAQSRRDTDSFPLRRFGEETTILGMTIVPSFGVTGTSYPLIGSSGCEES